MCLYWLQGSLPCPDSCQSVRATLDCAMHTRRWLPDGDNIVSNFNFILTGNVYIDVFDVVHFTLVCHLLQTLGQMASQVAMSAATQVAATPQSSQPGSPSHDDGAATDSRPAKGDKTLEDRVRETEGLIALRREQKLQEEREVAKAKETQRRSEGKDMVEAKRALKKQADQLWIQERIKQKEEERQARAEILAKVEQDKEERRRARQNVTPQHVDAGSIESSLVRKRVAGNPSSPSSSSPTSKTRLQFRLPHGGSVVEQFGSSSTLGDAREFVVEVGVCPLHRYTCSLIDNNHTLLYSSLTIPLHKHTHSTCSVSPPRLSSVAPSHRGS